MAYSTGFFFSKNGAWIDICNNMKKRDTPTTSSSVTNYYIKNDASDRDLADIYEINTAVNLGNDPLNFYTLFDSTTRDLGYLFNKPTPRFTLDTAQTYDIKQNGKYCAVLGNYDSSTNATFTVTNGPINITILIIGPGGNGGSKSATANTFGNGGSGGQLYWAKISLPTGTYTAIAGCAGTSPIDTTFTCTTTSPMKRITAYKGNDGASGVSSTTAGYTIGNWTSSNPTLNGFEVISRFMNFYGGNGGGFSATVNADAFGDPGFPRIDEVISGIEDDYPNRVELTRYQTDIPYAFTSVNTQTKRYYNGEVLLDNYNAYNFRFLHGNFNVSRILLTSSTAVSLRNITNGNQTSENIPFGFCAGGGGGNKTANIGGGTGGSYSIGGSNLSGGFVYTSANYTYTDPFDEVAGKKLSNGTNGRGFGCGGGGGSSTTNAVGGKGAPGAIFIYVG